MVWWHGGGMQPLQEMGCLCRCAGVSGCNSSVHCGGSLCQTLRFFHLFCQFVSLMSRTPGHVTPFRIHPCPRHNGR